jgi:glycosyltransferase involved in cell wall biosynthesis
MKIAHVTSTFPPYQGGTGNVCYYNARELARRGHDVHVFTAAAEGAPAQETREGVHIHRLRPLLRVGNAPILPQIVSKLRGFEVVHLHLPFIGGGELASLSVLLHRIPFVVTYHSDLIGDGTWRDLVFRAAMWSSRHAVLMQADMVLFVSEGHAETCAQRGVYEARRTHCQILPNGVDTGLFRPLADRQDTRRRLGLTDSNPVVGFVGVLDRAHHYKGLEVLMAALADPELAHVQLLVVGGGELQEHYQQHAFELGIDHRAVFCGAVGHDDLAAHYRCCDVFAVPSLAPESFGLVVAEGMACGIPVVASDGPGVRSLVEEGVNGWLTPAGDVLSLRQGLIKTLGMAPEQRAAMGRAGRRKVEERYAWEQIGARLEAIYRDILRQPSGMIKAIPGAAQERMGENR